MRLACPQAPLTCLNFLQLAGQGFFDGLPFHRVVPDFVVQGGDPRGDGSGGPGYTIRDEINRLRYDRGAVGMALAGPDTGGSQFFITLSPQPHLDGGYTVFGEVVAGDEVLDQIRAGRSDREGGGGAIELAGSDPPSKLAGPCGLRRICSPRSCASSLPPRLCCRQPRAAASGRSSPATPRGPGADRARRRRSTREQIEAAVPDWVQARSRPSPTPRRRRRWPRSRPAPR